MFQFSPLNKTSPKSLTSNGAGWNKGLKLRLKREGPKVAVGILKVEP